MRYQLYYWPDIQGRGEFVRLALEQAGAEYIDVARSGGSAALSDLLEDQSVFHPPFAVPALRDGQVLVAQTAVILLYMGPRLGLVPDEEQGRLWTHQIQLTIADLVEETHNTHHPVGSGAYYEDQKSEAIRAAVQFRRERLPKFLHWLETVLVRNPSGSTFLVQDRLTYADLSAFQVVDGLRHAFPNAAAVALTGAPHLVRLADHVRGLPNVAGYLESSRRIPFNEQGIFRHYPELDEPQ